MNFSQLSHDFCMNFSWFSHELLMTFSWLSLDFLMTFSWLFHDFLLTFSWLSPDFLINFSWFSHDFSWTSELAMVCAVSGLVIVTIVANIFRAFPRTLETFWWVTGHPGWVLGHIQRSCTRRIMFLTMFYSPPCSKSMLGTFGQVVEKMKSSLVTTRKNMDLSVKCAYVLKYSNRPLNWAYASFDL